MINRNRPTRLLRKLAITTLLGSTLMAHSAMAANTGLLLRLGYSAGGDNLYTAAFDDGSTEDLNAGQGLYGEIGLRLPFFSENLNTELTAGVHYNSISATNGDLTFTRVFGTAIQYLKLGNVRLGGGVYYAGKADLEFDTEFTNTESSLGSALGPAIAANIALSDRLTLGARAVSLEFEDDFGNTYDGSHIGAHLSLTF